MSMPHEPLTPEERALAQSLSRLGPHGGPSPELDARILGAARVAVQGTLATGGQAPPSRRRWPIGMGVAASVLLAAGVAWQLRPMHEVPVASEAPMASEQSLPAVIEAPDNAAADAAAPVADMPSPAPAMQEAPAPMAAKVRPPSPVERATTASGPARQNAEAAARQEPVLKRSPLSLIPVPVPTPPAPPAPEAPQAFPADADAYSYSAPAAAAVAADVSETAMREQAVRRDAQQDQEQQARYRAERQEAAKAEDERTLDAIAVTGSRVKSQDRRVRTREAVSAPVPAAAPPPPPPPAASAGSIQPSAARNALRRTDLQVPVDADMRLPPEEWLDRIRLRRDLGDDANALRSLQLFVQEHPFQRVPDDLRPLLGNP